jgi:hypothetical protein
MAFSSAISGDARLLSRPLRVEWAGWETNTYRLQQAGWKLSAEQDVYQNRMRLAMNHERMNLYAMSRMTEFDYEYAARDRGFELPMIVMQAMGREVFIQEHGRIDWGFNAIDAKPCFTENKITRIEDLAHFAAPLVRCNEVIIPEESVPRLMERILELQQPARTDRIKEQMRSPEGYDRQPQQKFQAQIISLAA